MNSVTGYPSVDTALRSLMMILGAIMSTALVGYLSAHGVSSQDILGQVPALVAALLSVVVTLVAAVWAVVSKRNAVAALVDHTTQAAVTGQIPDSVKALATPAQQVILTRAGK